MAELATPKPSNTVHEAAPLVPLQAAVKTYVLNDLDIETHPSYEPLQEAARASNGRPSAVSVLGAPAAFTASETLSGVTYEEREEVDISLEHLYRDTEKESQRLKQAMEEYETADGKSRKRSSVLSKNSHTWSDVLAEVDIASKQYNEPDGRWGKIRKAFRKSGDKAVSSSAWLALLPAQSDYFSVLCGGLTLIVGAASRLKDLREDIVKILVEIPIIISYANRAQNVVRTSRELRRSGAEVFLATITLLQRILMYFKAKAASKSITLGFALRKLKSVMLVEKAMSAIFGQSGYEQDLTDSIEMLRYHSSQFEKITQACCLEMIENTRTTVQALRVDASRNDSGVHQHLDLVRTEYHEMFKSLDDRISQTLQVVVAMVGSNPRLDQGTQDLSPPKLPIKRARSAPTLRRIRNEAERSCLNLLGYEEAVIQSNIQKNLRCAYQLPKPAQDRIIAIIRHQKVISWLGDIKSSVLFLNGHYNSPRAMAQSPTSFFCAKLATAIQSSSEVLEEPSLHPSVKTIAISFFCAEHLDSKDPSQGARGIVRSLIAQLLVCYSSFDTRLIKQLLESDLDHLKSLCATLKIIIGQLPEEVVLTCAIDAITMHEDSEVRCKKVEFVLDTLIGIAESDDGRNCVFKLLVTSPRVSRRYSGRTKGKSSASVLTMPEKVASQGTFTMTKWSDYMQASKNEYANGRRSIDS
ncbi:hypothetical protein G6011_07534 [Alternaria panax]|uniref:Uncharacterized protein n=1 Tax=Alternaria panax TaxID=48097 RepID=A0AAD4FE47_9PLEO|nr:hypothetical protein G6011_07534 [Alternaria panax]